jgi:hypothetical protein
VIFAQTTQQAAQDFAAQSGPKFVSCTQQTFPQQFAATAPPGATSSNLSVIPVPPPVSTTDAVAYKTTATVHMGTITIPLTIDDVFIRRGRAEIALRFNNVGTPFPPALERQLMQTVLNRA